MFANNAMFAANKIQSQRELFQPPSSARCFVGALLTMSEISLSACV